MITTFRISDPNQAIGGSVAAKQSSKCFKVGYFRL